MTQLTLNIENPAVLPVLRRMVGFMEGVSIAKTSPARKPRRQREPEPNECTLRAIEAVRNGEVFHSVSHEDLMAQLEAD